MFRDLLESVLKLNLTMGQVHVLFCLRRAGRCSGRQLAQQLAISPAAVVQVCDRLQEQGYIQREPDTEDRRITWLSLTPRSETLFETMLAAKRTRLGPALAALGPSDRATLVRILERLTEELNAGGVVAHDSEAPPPVH